MDDLKNLKRSFKTLSEFYSEDDQRKAYVLKDDKGVAVSFCEKDEHGRMRYRRQVDTSNHSLRYAEDAAENWVTYVIRD